MNNRADGFSLLEVVIATTVVAVALVSLAQLALLSRASDRAAAFITTASILAQNKMEQLRAAPFPDGGSTACCEFFGAGGVMLGNGPTAPVGTEYVRRWSIDPCAGCSDSARVLQVWVTPRGAAAVRLLSVRSRRAG
jgi:prepilin-type N-terminal cleavage/methylation domain-containing protein